MGREEKMQRVKVVEKKMGAASCLPPFGYGVF